MANKATINIKIFLKNSILTPEIKFQIDHADKNLIDLEDSD